MTEIKANIENKEKIELANKLRESEENAKLLRIKYSDELKEKQDQIETLKIKIEQQSASGAYQDPRIVAELKQNKKDIEETKRILEQKNKLITERSQEYQRKMKEKE